jgi:hypothetical protein
MKVIVSKDKWMSRIWGYGFGISAVYSGNPVTAIFCYEELCKR